MMSYRALEIEGRFASPPESVIELDGRQYSARAGEPLAITLLAHRIYVIGRSPKYHRPRGLLCGRGACGACLARVDGRPSQRLCLCRATDRCSVESQNAVAGARHDLLAAIDWLFAGGLDHHHLMISSATLNRFAIGVAHRLAGLGTLPSAPIGDVGAPPEVRRVRLAVVGAGSAGCAAAAAACARGIDTLVLDAAARDGDGVLGGAYVLGQYDDRELVVLHAGRQLRVEAEAVVIATGAHEQAPPCPGNDVPGLLLRRAAELALDYGVLPGRNVVLAVGGAAGETTCRAARKLGERLRQAGAAVRFLHGPAHAIAGAACDDRLPQLFSDTGVAGGSDPAEVRQLVAVEGGHQVQGVRVSPGGEIIECDAVVWCDRPAPAYELGRQMGIETPYDPALGGFVPRVGSAGESERTGVFVAGEAAGVEPARAVAHGRSVGAAAADYLLGARAGP